VTLIWGVGKAFAATLEKDGIRTIGQLQTMGQRCADEALWRHGQTGSTTCRAARTTARCMSSTRREEHIGGNNLQHRLRNRQKTFVPVLRALSEKVSHASEGLTDLAGRTVVLKLKDSSSSTRTRNRQLEDRTVLADRIFPHRDYRCWKRNWTATQFRLLGIGVSRSHA
jgi:DNA polymerase-4